jgi:hypothetical protein
MQQRLLSRLLSAILFVALSAGAVVPHALAQPERAVYVLVDYMKVPPGGGEEYVAVEQEIWKPIHQERMRRGLLTNWSLYDVSYTTPDAPYSYVTLNVFDDFEKLQAEISDDVVAAAHPDGDVDAMMERTMASRDIVHAEVWQLVGTATSTTETGPPGRYLVVNFMDAPAGAGEEYLAAESEIWKPIHQNRIDAGRMSGWAIYSLILPRGEAMHYNFGTVDFFNDPNDVVGTVDDATIRASHPDASEAEIEDMMNRTLEARSIYKSDLWTLIDTATGLEE